MMLSENIKMALGSIRSARLRSFFTMLGVIIGVVSVITMVSLGEGAKHRVIGQINHLGSDLITLRPGKLVNRNAQGDITSLNLLATTPTGTITNKDIDTITTNPDVSSVVPMSLISGLPTIDKQQYPDAVIISTNQNFSDIIGQKILYGSFFSSDDSDARTVVIGSEVAEDMFKELVPIGRSLTIRGQEFRVSGVFDKFPNDPTSVGIDYNNAIFMPVEIGQKISDSPPAIYQVLVKPDSGADTTNLSKSLTSEITTNHGGLSDFSVLKQDESLAVTNNVLGIITTAIASIAIVAIIVGGISIMNVMLVAVSERSREIGIRKAIGATDRQIRTQFLIEAAVLSIWGATIGVILAGFINLGLRVATNLEPVITWQPVVISVSVSILIGVFFGVIPAVKASGKDPIEALRPN